MDALSNEGFNEKYYGKDNKKIIGVDFDDTITEKRPYPEIAPLDKKAKKYLDKLHKAGFTLVLWTARMDVDYAVAYDRCIHEFGMDYIKMDSGEFKHGLTGKLIAKFYIDDRSYPDNIVPWRKIYRYLIKKYGS